MKTLHEKARLTAAASLLVLMMAVAPAIAESGSGSGTNSGSGSDDNTTMTTTSDSVELRSTSVTSESHSSNGKRARTVADTQASGENETEAANDDNVGNLESRVSKLLSEKRQNGKTHSADQKQKTCEKMQKGLDQKIANLQKNAQKHLAAFDKIFTAVQDYQTKNPIDGYTDLAAAVSTAQSDATTAVNALDGLSASIDCTATDPASAVATVKTAANDARTALQSYRAALKNLVKAMLDAKATTTQATQEDN